jgi:hypothetical protein
MSDMKMSDVKPKVGEWWICNLASVMGNGDSRSAYKMTPALIVACNVLPIERLYTQKDNDRMVEENAELRGALSSLDVATLNGCADYRETNLSRYVNKLLNKND